MIVEIERKLIDQGTKQTASSLAPKFTFNLKGCFFRKTYFGDILSIEVFALHAMWSLFRCFKTK